MVIPPCENHDDKMMIWICEWWDFYDDGAKYLGWWLLPQLRSLSPTVPVYSASLILSRWRDILPGSNEKREFAAIQVVLPKRTIELSEAETAGHLNQAIEENRSNQAEEEWDPIQSRKIFIRREIWNWSLEEKTISWCHQPDSKWISRPGDQGVSVRKGGNIKRGEWEGGGEDQKGGRGRGGRGRTRGKSFFSGWPGLDWRRVFGDLL